MQREEKCGLDKQMVKAHLTEWERMCGRTKGLNKFVDQFIPRNTFAQRNRSVLAMRERDRERQKSRAVQV